MLYMFICHRKQTVNTDISAEPNATNCRWHYTYQPPLTGRQLG